MSIFYISILNIVYIVITLISITLVIVLGKICGLDVLSKVYKIFFNLSDMNFVEQQA